MRRAAPILVVLLLAALAVGPPARADRILRIGVYSQNVSSHEAEAGARIRQRVRRPGRHAQPAAATPGAEERSPGRVGAQPSSQAATHPASAPASSSHPAWAPASSSSVDVYPTLPSDSPELRNPAPLGPGSFWYVDQSGHACQYLPDSATPCFRVVSPAGTAPGGGAAPVAAVSPAALAASVAARLPLRPGAIHTSPTSGLTGAASWFWLDPAPTTETLSVSLGGENVTVSAQPAVEWRFGDGGGAAGGAGVPYRPGPPPPGAVTHVYGTRCLPGDRGRNPYVLASCGSGGYPIEVLVSWRISYEASGPVGGGGSLPARTTVASATYPVSESRAFLLGGSR